MKMLLVGLFVALATIGMLFGCEPGAGESEQGAAPAGMIEPVDVGDAVDGMQTDLALFRRATAVTLPIVLAGPSATWDDGCPTVTWDIAWDERRAMVRLEYAEGCTLFGMPVSGAVEAEVAIEETVIPLAFTYEGFTLDGTTLDGEMVMGFGREEPIHLTFDAYLTLTADKSVHVLSFSDCVLHVDLNGTPFDPSDDGAYLYGAFVYVDDEGQEFWAAISDEDPIAFGGGCAYPLSGVLTVGFYVLGFPVEAWVDFGYPEPGACDAEFDWGIELPI